MRNSTKMLVWLIPMTALVVAVGVLIKNYQVKSICNLILTVISLLYGLTLVFGLKSWQTITAMVISMVGLPIITVITLVKDYDTRQFIFTVLATAAFVVGMVLTMLGLRWMKIPKHFFPPKKEKN